MANSVTGGAVDWVDNEISPGASCTYSHTGWQHGLGDVTGYAVSEVVTDGGDANAGVGALGSGPGIDRDDGRDSRGRFTGTGGYGANAQAQGLADYTELTGRAVVGDQVRATLPDGSYRYYDGLSQNADGTYQGVEVKSGTASLKPGQRAFDDQVNGGTPATANLRGVQIFITSTFNVNVQ